MNENFITDLHIQNFKSIKDLKLDCKRINLFIGKPNVGKSNILEGISLLSKWVDIEIEEFIRFDKLYNLYFESETENKVIVSSNNYITFIISNRQTSSYSFVSVSLVNFFGEEILNSLKNPVESTRLIFEDVLIKLGYRNIIESNNDLIKEYSESILKNYTKFLKDSRISKSNVNTVNLEESFTIDVYDNDGNYLNNLTESWFQNDIKCYKYIEKYKTFSYPGPLFWPNGNNIINVLETNKVLRIQVGQIFKEYGYNLVIDKRTSEIGIQKSEDGIIFRLPLDLVADTLKRFMFHLAAIKSNEDCILIFEEPEAHCFPGYISIIAEEIVKSEKNQFFIATHSPYILNEILENANREDVAIHLTYFENYETKVKTLSNEEVSELADYGVDIFFNIENYLPHVK